MSAFAVLTTSYFPSIDYFRVLSRHVETRIECWEHFQKQTIRNRCYILSANGILPLVVPVVHKSRSAIPVKDLQVSYRQPWQHRHWNALLAAYNRSPFFEHYADELKGAIFSDQKFLVDLNDAILEILLRFSAIQTSISRTDAYNASYGENDFRWVSEKAGRKPTASKEDENTYLQVFTAKFDFVAGMSVVDLLFNTGPEAAAYLENTKLISRKKRV